MLCQPLEQTTREEEVSESSENFDMYIYARGHLHQRSSLQKGVMWYHNRFLKHIHPKWYKKVIFYNNLVT